MANHSRRAVLTGLGVLTPIGSSPAAFWQSLVTGTSGIKPITLFDASALPCRIAGEISDFVARNLIEKGHRKFLNAMGRMVQIGVVAAQYAMGPGNRARAGSGHAALGSDQLRGSRAIARTEPPKPTPRKCPLVARQAACAPSQPRQTSAAAATTRAIIGSTPAPPEERARSATSAGPSQPSQGLLGAFAAGPQRHRRTASFHRDHPRRLVGNPIPPHQLRIGE